MGEVGLVIFVTLRGGGGVVLLGVMEGRRRGRKVDVEERFVGRRGGGGAGRA